MKCKNCNDNEAIKYSKYSSGLFCSKSCSASFSTKEKRKEINEKVKKTLTKREIEFKFCINCGKRFEIVRKRDREKDRKTCSKSCSLTVRWKDPEYRENITNHIRERCSNIEYRENLAIFGRKGGFGKKGYTKSGIWYQSSIEEKCFEYLELKNIKFETHKKIPNSSKISDIYLFDKNLWIEIDGIDREKRKKWLGEDYKYWIEKLEIYKKEKLNLIIVKSYEDFIKYLENIA